MAIKNPLSYYAGKATLAKRIIEESFPPIEEVKIYVEPFCGGASLFWSLPDTIPQFILNDNSDKLVTFYRLYKRKDKELFEMVEGTLFSESEHRRAFGIIFSGMAKSEAETAWAFWYLSSASFAYEVGKGFAFNRAGLKGGGGVSKVFSNRRDSFEALHDKIAKRNLTIFNRDFANLPRIYDEEGVLVYLDPPYIGTYLGHCGAWTIKDEIRLLNWANTFEKAKVVISGYLNNEEKTEFAKANDWTTQIFKVSLKAKKKGSHRKKEIVIKNF